MNTDIKVICQFLNVWLLWWVRGRRVVVLMINQQSFMWTSIFIHFVAFSLASHEQTCKLSIFTCDIIVHVFAPLKSSRQTARIELNERPLSWLKIKQL